MAMDLGGFLLLQCFLSISQSLTLTSTVSGDLCDGESATFTCTTTGSNTIFSWFIFGLNGEGDIRERTARVLSDRPSGRFSTTDALGGIPESNLMISNFTTADNGAVIYCNDAVNPTVFSNANITIRVGPINLTKTSSSSGVNSISLSWDCVGSGCRPIQYMIKWSESGVNENQTTTNDTSHTIRGLDGCTNYSVTVETQICGAHSLTDVIQTVEGEYLEAFTAVAVGDRIDVSYISACPNLQNIYCRFNISEIQSLPVSTLLVAFAGREAKGSFPYIREGVYTVSVTLLYSNGSVISGSTVQRQVEVVSESGSVLTTGAAVGISVAVCVFIMILLVITSFFLGCLFGKKRASSDNCQESRESKIASTVTNKQGSACYEAIEVEQKVSLETNPAYGVLK